MICFRLTLSNCDIGTISEYDFTNSMHMVLHSFQFLRHFFRYISFTIYVFRHIVQKKVYSAKIYFIRFKL
jgi:hypothetical protein